MLKRKNLKVPQDARSCCSAQAGNQRDGSQSKANVSHKSSDNTGLLSPFYIEMDPAFDGLTGTDHQYHDLDQNFSFALSETQDPFHRLETDAQSHVMMAESNDQRFSPLLPLEGSAMDIAGSPTSSSHPMTVDLNQDPFDFHIQNAIPSSRSYRQTQPGQRNSPRHNSLTDVSQSSHVRESSSGSVL